MIVIRIADLMNFDEISGNDDKVMQSWGKDSRFARADPGFISKTSSTA
ncbi:hypothetical protein PO124_13265 [Bacillus licheniformis]|nr:hypothetical protein [Bacillus licheniformis]